MAEVLIVDAEYESHRKIKDALGEGFHCTNVSTEEEALKILSHIKFDAVLVDELSSSKVCKNLNANDCPVFLMSESLSTSKQNQLRGLGLAGFISKPLQKHELQSKIHSKLSQSRAKETGVASNFEIRRDGLLLLPGLQKAYRLEKEQQQDLKLTGVEFKILFQLILKAGTPISRESLASQIDLCTQSPQSRKVDAHISKLRRKLKNKSHLIASLYRVGYVYRSYI